MAPGTKRSRAGSAPPTPEYSDSGDEEEVEEVVTPESTPPIVPDPDVLPECEETMRAFVYDQTLAVQEGVIRVPPVESNQILVRVDAVSVNHHDFKKMPAEGCPDPEVPGIDCCGVVVGKGGDVKEFNNGDKVMCICDGNAFAQYAAVDSCAAWQCPQEMTSSQAASCPYAFVAAWIGLEKLGFKESLWKSKKRSESGTAGKNMIMLVIGGAGGVTLFAIQLGKHLGMTVIGTFQHLKTKGICEQFGADHMISHDKHYTGEATLACQLDILGVKSVDCIFNAAGADNFAEGDLEGICKPNGSIVHTDEFRPERAGPCTLSLEDCRPSPSRRAAPTPKRIPRLHGSYPSNVRGLTHGYGPGGPGLPHQPGFGGQVLPHQPGFGGQGLPHLPSYDIGQDHFQIGQGQFQTGQDQLQQYGFQQDRGDNVAPRKLMEKRSPNKGLTVGHVSVLVPGATPGEKESLAKILKKLALLASSDRIRFPPIYELPWSLKSLERLWAMKCDRRSGKQVMYMSNAFSV